MISEAHELVNQIHLHLNWAVMRWNELRYSPKTHINLSTPEYQAKIADAENMITFTQKAYYDALLEYGVYDMLAARVSDKWVIGRYDSDPNRRKDRRLPYELFTWGSNIMFVVVSQDAPTKKGFEYESRLDEMVGQTPIMYRRSGEMSKKSRRTGKSYWRNAQTSRVLIKGCPRL
jgi:hypothetical protein